MKITLKKFPSSINKFIGRDDRWEYQKEKKDYAYYVRMATVGKRVKIKECDINYKFYFKDKKKRYIKYA